MNRLPSHIGVVPEDTGVGLWLAVYPKKMATKQALPPAGSFSKSVRVLG